jgi:phage-related minor tail protein
MVHAKGGPSEREYREKLGKIRQKLDKRAADIKNEFERFEKAKVEMLKKTKETKHEAEREVCKIEEGMAKSKDLAPESKGRLRLEIDVVKNEIRREYSELETRIAEAVIPAR